MSAAKPSIASQSRKSPSGARTAHQSLLAEAEQPAVEPAGEDAVVDRPRRLDEGGGIDRVALGLEGVGRPERPAS